MKNKVLTIFFLIIVFGLGAVSICIKDILVSKFERRTLTQFPTELDEDFTKDLDDYLVDQFAYRNQFISLNSNLNRNMLNKIDDKDVYIIDNNIYEINYPLNEKNTIDFTTKMNYITEKYFKEKNVYYSVIPDKSYFLDSNKYLKLDYTKMFDVLDSNMNGKYIDITDDLTIDDYYLTDIHWKQENIQDIAAKIMTRMGNTYIHENYEEKTYNNFYGASYSKGSSDLKTDTLKYLTNINLEQIKVAHLEHGMKNIYDEQKLYGVDSYDVFLSGPSSYLEIENKETDKQNTLIVFRDSFASSIIPYFVPYYNKIIVIDLRYIDLSLIEDKINYDNSDVLYLYSTLIINSSSILKVNIK